MADNYTEHAAVVGGLDATNGYIPKMDELTRVRLQGNRFMSDAEAQALYATLTTELEAEEEEEAYVDPATLTWRQRIYKTLDDPDFSPLAYKLAVWDIILIVCATTTFMLETIPNIGGVAVFFIIETFVIANFTFFFLARLFTAPSQKIFWSKFSNIIDFIAILPYYIEVIVAGSDVFNDTGSGISGLASLRIIRLARIFRLFKFGRFTVGFALVGKAVMRSKDGFYLLGFILILMLIFWSSMMYYLENLSANYIDGYYYYSDDGERTPFQSIPGTFWWCIVTLTTVGYGDEVPITAQGRFVASLTMICALIFLSFPITILGINFGDVYTEQKIKDRKENVKKLKRLLDGRSAADSTGDVTATASIGPSGEEDGEPSRMAADSTTPALRPPDSNAVTGSRSGSNTPRGYFGRRGRHATSPARMTKEELMQLMLYYKRATLDLARSMEMMQEQVLLANGAYRDLAPIMEVMYRNLRESGSEEEKNGDSRREMFTTDEENGYFGDQGPGGTGNSRGGHPGHGIHIFRNLGGGSSSSACDGSGLGAEKDQDAAYCSNSSHPIDHSVSQLSRSSHSSNTVSPPGVRLQGAPPDPFGEPPPFSPK
eukprot:Clim_evm40s151 gene=Clim_evmTU40s151